MASMYEKVFMGDKIVARDEATISIASSAVLYGLSVYTVFPVNINREDSQKYAFRLETHFDRLVNSSKIIGIDNFTRDWNFEKFKKTVQELIKVNTISNDVYVRATIHVDAELAGTRSRGLHTILSIFVYDAIPILKPEGSRLKTSHWRRVPDYAIPSRAKVNGAYVNSVLAKQDALDNGADDCLFIDAQGHVCELSAANIFVVRHGELLTPDSTSDLLEGINRNTIIEIARNELKITVKERSIDLTELYISDEVFACGTSANISPILEIDNRIIGTGKPGEMTLQLQQLHQDVLSGRSAHYRHWLTKI